MLLIIEFQGSLSYNNRQVEEWEKEKIIDHWWEHRGAVEGLVSTAP